jgi:hypothetical protein
VGCGERVPYDSGHYARAGELQHVLLLLLLLPMLLLLRCFAV